MTRKSRRELERTLEDLDAAGSELSEEVVVVYEDPKMGEWYDRRNYDHAEHVLEDEIDDSAIVVVIRRTVVMEREQAEQEGREILGPAEDAPGADDPVQVVWGDSWRGSRCGSSSGS